jgi:single-strand DNA-binding protein
MLNLVQLIGNLGRDPEGFETKNGKGCRLSVATTSKSKGEEFTEWHRVVVFGQAAEFCLNYLAKGRKVYVEGRNQTSKYQKDGVDHYSTDVVSYRVTALDKGDAAAPAAAPSGGTTFDSPAVDPDVDDVPF